MKWLLYLGLALLAAFVLVGLDDQRRRRADARAELDRAHAAGHPASLAITYRDAHPRAHADHRALLPHIPHQRKGRDR